MKESGPAPQSDLLGTVLSALDAAQIGLVVRRLTSGGEELTWVSDAAAALVGQSALACRAHPELLALAPRAPPVPAAASDGAQRFRALLTHRERGDVPVDVTTVMRGAGNEHGTVTFLSAASGAGAGEQSASFETRFRTFAELAPDAIMVLAAGRFAYANPAGMRLLGVQDLAELQSRPVQEWIDEADRPMMMARLRRVAGGEQLGPQEYRATRRDGTTVTVEIVSLAIEHEGQPAVLAMGRDVSERHRLQGELRRADQLAALGTLAAGVAHEINNPLSYALLHLKHLGRELDARDGGPESSPAAKALHEVLDGCERIRIVVSDLLSFARPSSDVIEAVDLEDVLDAALKLASHALRHRARLVRLSTGAPRVRGNHARLVQVFVNLLLNAAQAFPDDSTERNEIAVTLGSDALGAVVTVSDNGCGIPETDLAHVFDPFFTTKPTGTGLGLAVSRSIVEAFGGELVLGATRTEGPTGMSHTGTCATIRLVPFAGGPATEDAAREGPTRPARRGRVLVVDDEPVLANLLAQLLAPAHDVEVCVRSRDALHTLLERDFDVVLCDLMMPELTGIDLYERVCARRPSARGRFVFVTGGVFTAAAAEFLARERPLVLAKPFTHEELEAVLQDTLAQAEATA